MEAVRHDRMYPLRDPRGGYWTDGVMDPRGELQAQRSGAQAPAALPARTVWQRIVEAAWRSGEPGIAFIDRISADNPVSSLGPIRSSNPCGEYWQVDYSSCNLGSINVSRFLTDAQQPNLAWQQRIDWSGLANVARTGVRFLDHVVNVSEFPIQEIREVTLKSRPVGLGVMGFADLLLKLGIRYGSLESVTLAERVMQWVQYWAWVESAEAARRFAAFPELDRNRGYFASKMARLTEKFSEAFSAPEFSHLRQLAASTNLETLYKQSGVRNCHVTVQAPTGSIGLIAECSSGIEPIFAFEYTRQDSIGVRTHRHVELERWQKAHPDQPLPDSFVDASHVKPEEHILIQAAFQKYVDNAVSKTANLPAGATPQDVEQIYRLAYEKGLKSVTVYMEGSREGVLLRNPSGAGAIETRPVEQQPETVPPGAGYVTRPEFLQGLTRKIRTPFGTVYVTVNFDSRLKQITEVFVRESSGNEAWELVGRLLSLLLRSGVALDKVLSQLYRTRGQNTIILDEKILSSVAQAIAQTIERADQLFRRQSETGVGALEAPAGMSSSEVRVLQQSPAALARVCPECGRQTLFPAGGCLTCTTCGFSTCGGSLR
jgi:ribonucleoside-diphosphate reductase alpha chain